MAFNAFQTYSWVRLVDTLLKFKADLARASRSKGSREIEEHCFKELCEQMKWVIDTLKDPALTNAMRLTAARKLQGAECFSLKIKKNPEDFEGTLGTVDQVHAFVDGPDGSMVELAHVTFKTADGNGTMRHRLEEIRLRTEPWWFSPVEHKAPKK